MKVDDRLRRSIWLADDGQTVEIVDQVRLPHRFETARLATLEDAARAIRDMHVRDANLDDACHTLLKTRPTAVNLRWALDAMRAVLRPLPAAERRDAAYAKAAAMAEDDVAQCHAIARHGLERLRAIAARAPGRPLNILTHCNAGWLAAVDWGTATAPIYAAHEAGLPVHVFVDETRPRNQGASLTAWELGQHGVPHSIVVDNVGGHLMQHGMVDCVIVGTDRTTATGDVCNKIGTYLKALAADANRVPFYVAAPSSSIDFGIDDGVRDIPIEERSANEVTHMSGLTASGEIAEVQVSPTGTPVLNYAFDVTPAALVTGLITERGVVAATREGLARAFPDLALREAAE